MRTVWRFELRRLGALAWLGPGVLCWWWASTHSREWGEAALQLVPVVAAFGLAAVAGVAAATWAMDARDPAFALVLSQPLPRWRLWLGRVLAVLALLAWTLAWTAAALARVGQLALLAPLAVAATAYLALAMLVSVLTSNFVAVLALSLAAYPAAEHALKSYLCWIARCPLGLSSASPVPMLPLWLAPAALVGSLVGYRAFNRSPARRAGRALAAFGLAAAVSLLTLPVARGLAQRQWLPVSGTGILSVSPDGRQVALMLGRGRIPGYVIGSGGFLYHEGAPLFLARHYATLDLARARLRMVEANSRPPQHWLNSLAGIRPPPPSMQQGRPMDRVFVAPAKGQATGRYQGGWGWLSEWGARLFGGHSQWPYLAPGWMLWAKGSRLLRQHSGATTATAYHLTWARGGRVPIRQIKVPPLNPRL